MGAGLLLAQRRSSDLGKASLIAEDGKDYGYSAADARKFLEALTRRLQVSSRFTMTAYEDIFFHFWKERRLPVIVDPLDPKLQDPVERARLAHIFEEGRGQADRLRASAAPHPDRPALRAGRASPGFSLTKRMFLIPGDSPMGYRLPLESLPWTKPEDVIIPSIPTLSVGATSCPSGRNAAWICSTGHQRTMNRRPPRTGPNQKKTKRKRSPWIPSRALRPGARRKALHLHAAGRVPGGLSRPGRRHRRHRSLSLHAGVDRRLCAALRSAHLGPQSHARSRA